MVRYGNRKWEEVLNLVAVFISRAENTIYYGVNVEYL
jgi:hypothetical protein